jgi:hypothetical protein
VPVVDYHASFDDIYRELPSVRVSNWANFTPASLELEAERIAGEAAAGRYNARMVYWPYWLSRLTRYMPVLELDHGPRHLLDEQSYGQINAEGGVRQSTVK